MRDVAVPQVSSFPNVDEEAVLKISGVRYAPSIGKVTTAMLERNLLRLYTGSQLQLQSAAAAQAVGLPAAAVASSAASNVNAHASAGAAFVGALIGAALATLVLRQLGSR